MNLETSSVISVSSKDGTEMTDEVTVFKLTFMYQTISLNPILDKTYIKHAADSI